MKAIRKCSPIVLLLFIACQQTTEKKSSDENAAIAVASDSATEINRDAAEIEVNSQQIVAYQMLDNTATM